MNQSKKLYRIEKGGVLAGVCGGLAEYLNLDPSIVRVLWAALSFAWGTGVALYIICAVILPKKSDIYPGY